MKQKNFKSKVEIDVLLLLMYPIRKIQVNRKVKIEVRFKFRLLKKKE